MKMQSISKQSTDDKHIGVIDIPVQPFRFGCRSICVESVQSKNHPFPGLSGESLIQVKCYHTAPLVYSVTSL